MGAKSSLPSKQHSRVRVFEDLSNDLLLKVFHRLSSKEIHQPFGCLNSRLDNLIVTDHQYVDLEGTPWYSSLGEVVLVYNNLDSEAICQHGFMLFYSKLL